MASKPTPSSISRRDFLKTSALASLTVSAGMSQAFAAGSDKIRIGVIGCGGRGRYDTGKCLEAADNLEITAVADLFPEQADAFVDQMRAQHPDGVRVPPEARFSGFDGYRKLLASDIDLVLMTQPPHFRPLHFQAAIEEGKHVFMEKPVAVDPVGVRSILNTAELADQKNLTVLAGTQMRRLAPLVEIMKRIHDGGLGDLTSGHTTRLGGGLTGWGVAERQPEWSDMEWQLRRWFFYTWLGGDFPVEQHVHNLDLINWALDAHPVQCVAVGGRQARTGEIFGDVYDHISVEYTYPGDVRIAYTGAQIDGIHGRNDQRLFGSEGVAYFDFGRAVIEGRRPFEFEGPLPDPVVRQFADQIDAIRNGQHLNEAVQVAESTLTAIMARMSAYTGRSLSWDWVMQGSELDLSPDEYAFTDLPERTVAVPGETPLI